MYIPSLDPPLELYGSEPRSTNNRMEMQAAIEALRAMPDGADILILSDSKLLVKGMNEWMLGWINNGRLLPNSSNPVANVDLWKILLDESACRTVRWKWVKGHSGIHGNEVADRLANKGCKESGRTSQGNRGQTRQRKTIQWSKAI
nr:ribonuclease H [Ferrovum myxofaciens]